MTRDADLLRGILIYVCFSGMTINSIHFTFKRVLSWAVRSLVTRHTATVRLRNAV